MADPFIAEIRMFSGNFAPQGWAFCNGQLLPISQNTALFSLLGTIYGGDGRTTFALPNLQGCSPLQAGQAPGLSNRDLGEAGGSSMVTLLASELPPHTHALQASANGADQANPSGQMLGSATVDPIYSSVASTPNTMHPQALAIAGGGQPHNNMQPYLVVNFIIALQGIYPPRS